MRVLAVVSDELLGADDARGWAFLESLVAVNSPTSIDVEVLALINQPAASIATANPLGRAVGPMATGPEPTRELYDPADGARQRLDRSLRHLRSLGLGATGEIGPGDDPHRLIRRTEDGGNYDRMVLLLHDKQPWLARSFAGTRDPRRQTSTQAGVTPRDQQDNCSFNCSSSPNGAVQEGPPKDVGPG